MVPKLVSMNPYGILEPPKPSKSIQIHTKTIKKQFVCPKLLWIGGPVSDGNAREYLEVLRNTWEYLDNKEYIGTRM